MSIQAVLSPVFVLVVLAFALHFWMGFARVSSLKRGETRLKDVAMREPNWARDVTKINNAYHNQLELPLFFYVLVALVLITKVADLMFVVLAWAFVLSRLVHAWVMVTSNHVPSRFKTYVVGVTILLTMWVIFAVDILALA